MSFANQIGLFALLSIIPFILLYLRKPKPIEKVIPSLMFFIKEKKNSKQYAFLRKLVQNLLFFVQLLALIGLSIAVAEPFVKVHYDTNAENTVIILDGSASMQTKNGLITRFDKALIEAKKYLSGKVSIILAEDFPLIIVQDESIEIAQDLLGKLKPKTTGTNIGDAMLLAKEILKGKHGKVVVLSDFINSAGPDILATKRVLTSENIDVTFVAISNNAKNIGITELKIDKNNVQVFVKNYNDKDEKVILRVLQSDKVITRSEQVTVLPKSVEAFVFPTIDGVSKIELENQDDFELDNYAYINIPYKKKIKVLLVSDVKKSSITDALESSSDIEIERKYFTPERSLLKGYDIILLNQFQYVPGTFIDLNYYVESGGNLILTAQDKIAQIDLGELNILNFNSVTNVPTTICVEIINQFTKQFEKERCFARITKYYTATPNEGTLILAVSSDNTPIIAMKEKGKGKIVYYGIFDDSSDFKTLPSYPILWNSLVNFLVKSEDIKEFNIKSGRIIGIPQQNVKTPSGTLSTTNLIIDEIGIYEFNDKKYAVNLLNEKESDVSSDVGFEKENSKFLVKSDKKEMEMYLSIFLLVVVSLLLLFEIFYLKRRGDL